MRRVRRFEPGQLLGRELQIERGNGVVQVLHRIRGALAIVGAPVLADSGLEIEERLALGIDLASQSIALAAFQLRLRRLLDPLIDDSGSSHPTSPTPP